MAAIDPVLAALGRGDTERGVRVASIAIALVLPIWLALAIVLAIGPGK